MSMFDSIISEAREKFNLGGKAETLLSALLALMTDKNRGSLAGFLEKFNAAGLGDTASSWVGAGSNTPVSNEQIESALGKETLQNVADQTGTNFDTATSATAYMVPRIVDALTPGGVIPQEGDLQANLGGYLTGGAALGGMATESLTGGLPDKADASVGNASEATRGTSGGINQVGSAAGAVSDRFGDGMHRVGNDPDDGDGSILKWLIPLLLLGLLIVLGYMFCGKSTPVVTTNANSNTNARGNAIVNANANTNQAVVVNNNSAALPVNDAPLSGERKLTEVSLPDGTKLQAYPGGIEDQLVKFIQSDEYKKGTADTLKDKWFSFDDLNFVFGKTELVPESKRQLDNIVAILKAFPDVKMKIGGYTDKKGDDAANKKLSDERAKAVKAALEKAGVGAQVPEAEGYGEEFAKVPETATDKEREADRKTSVRLLK